MATASKQYPTALLGRGVSVALLSLSVSCANSPPLKTQQPVPPHHIESLPLDEFGYLFPHAPPASATANPLAMQTPLATPPLTAVQAPPAATQPVATAAKPMPPVRPPSIIAPMPSLSPAPLAIATPPSIIATPAAIAPQPALDTPAADVTTQSDNIKAASTPHFITKVLHFSTHMPFRLNRATLSHKNNAALGGFVDSLEQYRGVLSIRITGHTDITGPARFNKWLSMMRARSAQRLLLSLGVDPRTLTIRGVGSSLPRPHARSNADNRYVDIVVVVREPAR